MAKRHNERLSLPPPVLVYHCACVSVLSSNDEACAVLTENPAFATTCVNVLKKYPGRQGPIENYAFNQNAPILVHIVNDMST